MYHRAIALFTALVLLSLVPATAPCQIAEEQMERSFRAGQMDLQQGQFARAAEEFKKVLQIDPTLLEAQST